MNEVDFGRISDATLVGMVDALEPADEEGMLNVDLQGGVLTIELVNGRQFIVSKHAPSKQLWLSSPISGGLHFSFNADSMQWVLADGRSLTHILSDELQTLAGVEVKL